MTQYFFDFENENGFFCVFFFFLESYIYCTRNKLPLYIKDDKWKFLHSKGLDDYFLLNSNVIKKYNLLDKNLPTHRFGHMKTKKIKANLNDYRKASHDLYRINPDILTDYNLPHEYNSIFIRGGDKLLYEAKHISIEKYIDKLLSIDSLTKNLFVHSDDNLYVQQIKDYVLSKQLDIQIFSITTPASNGGAVVMKRLNYGPCSDIKSVDDMDNNEVKNHTLLFLNAIEIMRKSKHVICSFDTNVSRFMKINFTCKVISVNGNNNIPFHHFVKNPAYGFK